MKEPQLITTRCLAAASLLTVFILDIVTPPSFVADILYLCSSLLVFRESPRTIRVFSMVACLLIVADVLFFDLKLNLGISFWANRGMSVLAIIITSDLAIRFRKLNQASSIKEHQHLEALNEILFITSHRVRKPVANIIGLTDLINNESGTLTADDLKKHCRHLSSSANELDEIIKELNNFVEHSEQENLAVPLYKPVIGIFPAPQCVVPGALEIVA